MAVLEANAPQMGSLVSRLALLVDRRWDAVVPGPDATVSELLRLVKGVGREGDAIKIRIARLLAWAKTQDLQNVGYPSWAAFVKEHSPWRGSRTRDLLRFVESPLSVVKSAVSRNEIKLTVATRAPKALGGEASPEAQLRWLGEAKLAVVPGHHPAPIDVLSGEDMRRVLAARDLGAILIGGEGPVPVIDGFLIDCHARKLTNDQILERARAAPPVPERLGRAVPDWKDDPADSIVGPWSEPTDLADAVAKLRATAALLDLRRMVLGMAYSRIREHDLWRSVPGCASLEELCLVHLGIAQRTFQRYARAGLHHLRFPELRREVERGRLTLDRAMFAADHAGGSHLALRNWMELVRRLGRAEMQHSDERDADPLQAHAGAPEMARAVEMKLRRRDVSADATGIGGTAERIARHLRAVGATGPIQVAVRDDPNRRAPRRPPDFIVVPRGLLAAAEYVLGVVELPAAHGTRRMVERDRYTCQNPRCRRRTLRVHPHHLHEQQHGGSDEPSNILTVCPACHLRGIHSGNLSVVRIEDWLVWTWPGGGAVIMSSPVSDLVYRHQKEIPA